MMIFMKFMGFLSVESEKVLVLFNAKKERFMGLA